MMNYTDNTGFKMNRKNNQGLPPNIMLWQTTLIKITSWHKKENNAEI